jgi:hypothetical protein
MKYILTALVVVAIVFSAKVSTEYNKHLRLQEINHLFEQDMRGEIVLSEEELSSLVEEFHS